MKNHEKKVPFADFPVASQDAVLDVDWMVPHATKHHSLVQTPEDKHGIMPL